MKRVKKLFALVLEENITLQLPLAISCESPCPLVLFLDERKVGIVFGKVTQATDSSKFLLNISFKWSDVINPSAIADLISQDTVTVKLVCLEDKSQHWELGSIKVQILSDFLSASIFNAQDVLIAIKSKQQSGNLPLSKLQISSDVTLVAFYLPQYHPIVENDVWWGQGFTEWIKVAAAMPCFLGHQQPRLPSELGFYDLRLVEVLADQVRLAREYGIGAFCFYYYWFGGRRLLERPLELFLANPQINMPFCICWANEPWTRCWDGLEKEVLMEQPHTPETDARFILDIIPLLKDPRYLRVKSKPLLLVYRAALLSLPLVTTALWRRLCRDAGVGEIELVAVESFGFEFPDDYGFDSTVEFPPHGFDAEQCTVKPLKKQVPFEGNVWPYKDAAAFYCSQPRPAWRRYRGVMPGWDNTPRRGNKGNAFVESTPASYASWLTLALQDTRAHFTEGERLVFINAWNEWGEGAILEPDQAYGRSYLEATRDALLNQSGWEQHLSSLVDKSNNGTGPTLAQQCAVDYIKAQIKAYERTLAFMAQRQMGIPVDLNSKQKVVVFNTNWPEGLDNKQTAVTVLCSLDQFGLTNKPDETPIRSYQSIRALGWMLMGGLIPQTPPKVYFMLNHKETQQSFFATIENRWSRPDLVAAFNLADPDETLFAGFDAKIDCSNLLAGSYAVNLLQQVEASWMISQQSKIVTIL